MVAGAIFRVTRGLDKDELIDRWTPVEVELAGRVQAWCGEVRVRADVAVLHRAGPPRRTMAAAAVIWTAESTVNEVDRVAPEVTAVAPVRLIGTAPGSVDS